jgi:hypothetical protein
VSDPVLKAVTICLGAGLLVLMLVLCMYVRYWETS